MDALSRIHLYRDDGSWTACAFQIVVVDREISITLCDSFPVVNFFIVLVCFLEVVIANCTQSGQIPSVGNRFEDGAVFNTPASAFY